jgi:PAS domain S-box-containing protein
MLSLLTTKRAHRTAEQVRMTETAHTFTIRRYGFSIAVVWSLIVAYSLFWSYREHGDEALLVGKMQGQAYYEKDVIYRRWASRHGGMYVPVTGTTQPNPFLAHIPERDITTPSGKQLTLMNPAYMTRQIFEMSQQFNVAGRGHITSLNPVRAGNAPDAWEKTVLQKFEQGTSEIGQLEFIDGKPYYRYMQALVAEKPCLKCHLSQGYHEGDVRGGLSVSVAMEPIYAMIAHEMRGVYLNHFMIWVLGLGLIGFGSRKISLMTTTLTNKAIELQREIEEHNASQVALRKQAALLEEEVTERRNAQEDLQKHAVMLEQEISERLAAQEELQKQAVLLEAEIAERKSIEETVRASEEKFSKAFDNAPIAITITRIDNGIYLDVNRKFSELSGLGHEEVVGRPSVEPGWMTPEQRQLLAEEFLQKGSINGVELQLKSKEGKAVTCIFNGQSITVDGVNCLLTLAYDVTEQRMVEAQLRHAQKMEAIGQLAGGIAHDFNNILTVIMGYGQLLQGDPRLDTDQQEKVDMIVTSTEKASQLTRGLLMFSRKEITELKEANLNDIIHNMHKFLLRIIGEDIRLKSSTDTPVIPVSIDAGQIEQLLINLAANARDAMVQGGTLSIETGVLHIEEHFVTSHGEAPPGRYACISVSDTGSGMDESTRKRIFEPFFTTKELGKGTGLGMAIVYGVVRQHNGFITVSSEPEIGTTFRIYLTINEKVTDLQEKQFLPDSPVGGTETLLIAEDELFVRTLLDSVLTGFGYTVILAENGQDAVEKFAQHRDSVKLLLLDMIMPCMNGQEALQEIRRMQPGIKAFYLSGYTADFIKSRGVNEEGIELISKPFQPLDLLRKIRNVLDTCQSEHAL